MKYILLLLIGLAGCNPNFTKEPVYKWEEYVVTGFDFANKVYQNKTGNYRKTCYYMILENRETKKDTTIKVSEKNDFLEGEIVELKVKKQ